MEIFSSLNRNDYLDKVSNSSFDLVVIGGGVTGAGIAWDATLRGLKVLLLEQNDFASGTSSKSTKLIHGGLRYLKQLKFRQVYEVGRERAIVHKVARFLVRPEKMLLPIYKNGSLSRMMAGFALAVYDTLAGVDKSDSFAYLNSKKTSLLEPLLPGTNLVSSFLYAEYQTDDNRLTWSLIQSATERGASCINYAKAVKLNTDGASKICSIDFEDKFSGRVIKINTSLVINAGGPWVMDVIDLDSFPPKKELLLSKGTHIVLPHTKLPLQHALYFDDNDKKRMIFAIPRDGITYIGTTDLTYVGNKNKIESSKSEIDYLINTLHVIFPQLSITINDILSSWVGVRPLIKEMGKSSTEVSRKDEIFISKSGLLSIAGGKLTGYRKMADKVLNQAFRLQKIKFKNFKQHSETKTTPLAGNSFPSEKDFFIYLENLKIKFHQLGLDKNLAESYLKRYGDKIMILLSYLEENEHTNSEKLLLAEIKYGIYKEMIFFPADFLQRQTGMLWFNKSACEANKQLILAFFSREFSWNEVKIKSELIKFDELMATTLDFKQ
jgi:glycerol-3-phosphate dehydrogenase